MANYASMGSTKQSDDGVDDDNDEKDDTKRKSRNLSEKKRRDQFNTLVNELGSMVTANTRKMDKSTVLKSTILFLKNHNEISVRSRVHEIQENWKPSFLSNEEFTHLILEALDGFIMVFSSSGCIHYASESVTSLLGYLPSELVNTTIYDITYQDDQSKLYNVLLNPKNDVDGVKEDNQVSFTCHIKRGGLDFREETSYELVQFVGYFRSDADMETLLPNNRHGSSVINDKKLIFVGTGRLRTPQLIREMSFVDSAKLEFTSRHSLEWKFLFLDHRAPPIIGYLPFEVLGTSGYDYYHVDDLDKVVTSHESLMQKGEGTSCHYRFLTKGQQWIWLKTRFYIDYNQWNSKPEFIVCTHNVVSYTDVIKQLKTKNNVDNSNDRSEKVIKTTTRLQQATPSEVKSSGWSPKSSKPIKSSVGLSRLHYQCSGSDTTSMLEVSASSGHSLPTVNSIKTILQSEPAPLQHRRQNEDDQSSSSYADLQDFPNEPSLPIIPTQFVTPALPTAPVPNPLIMNQPIVVMANPQDQLQNELQRKHEELQQLIVHHQDELRRVSEQLLIARYGILSPLINSSAPYNVNPCQSIVSNCNSPSSGDIANTPSSNSTQGMNVLPLPMTLPVLTVPMEPFAHLSASMAANDAMIPQQQQIQQHERPQHHQRQPELPQMSHQEGHITPMMQYDLCPEIEISYANIDIAATAQPRLNNN